MAAVEILIEKIRSSTTHTIMSVGEVGIAIESRMILEVRAVAPFYKNGFVVGCERTREAVIIDPGDEVDELLGGRSRSRTSTSGTILLTHAHIDHITGVGRDEGRTRRAGLPAPGRPVSLRGRGASRARCSASRSGSRRRSTSSTT